MKEESQFDVAYLAEQLDQLIRLVALSVVGDKKQREQISILSRAGLDRHQIAEILGTTPGTVSVELSNLKSTSRRKDKHR
jgi:DNA-binding NarL/FixJ family response regulator